MHYAVLPLKIIIEQSQLMKMLYHYSYAGLKGCEIEEFMVLDYSAVSMGRKRLRRKRNKTGDGSLFDNPLLPLAR